MLFWTHFIFKFWKFCIFGLSFASIGRSYLIFICLSQCEKHCQHSKINKSKHWLTWTIWNSPLCSGARAGLPLGKTNTRKNVFSGDSITELVKALILFFLFVIFFTDQRKADHVSEGRPGKVTPENRRPWSSPGDPRRTKRKRTNAKVSYWIEREYRNETGKQSLSHLFHCSVPRQAWNINNTALLDLTEEPFTTVCHFQD